jgi:hypothetical protein
LAQKFNRDEHLWSAVMDEETQKPSKVNYVRLAYLVLMVTGILIYLVWGILYNAFFDVGLYSVVILLVGFGLCGYLLYGISPTGGKK